MVERLGRPLGVAIRLYCLLLGTRPVFSVTCRTARTRSSSEYPSGLAQRAAVKSARRLAPRSASVALLAINSVTDARERPRLVEISRRGDPARHAVSTSLRRISAAALWRRARALFA